MDRTYGSDDMMAERHEDRIDQDREDNGYRCLPCGKVGMTEDEFIYHECPEADDEDDETEE